MLSGVAYMWSLMGFVTIIRGFLPPEFDNMVRRYAKHLIKKLWGPDPYCSFHFQELDGRRRTNNLYRVVEMHLRAKHLFKDADDLYLTQEETAKKISYSLGGNETVSETLDGVKVWWTFSSEKKKGANGSEREDNLYTLKMRRQDKPFVMSKYMDYVQRSAKEYKTQLRDLYLYSCQHERWKSHTFHHPSTFDTLAMDPESKARLMSDLKAFMEGEAYFKKVGRPWKRGYLLYGPPGTGKSSLIAAMANLLKYNIYDLELTQVYDNSQLKMLLTNTTSKSIIVIEDIDCSLDLTGSRGGSTQQEKPITPGKQASSGFSSRVTLSGLLNFTDGLWSCCGNERIIIFTTNHIEKLDPGLLRPGRMDMHIHMSFCNFEIFKILALNYLSVTTDPLFDKIEQLLLEESVHITPAEVTEFLFEHKDDKDMALQSVVEDLERRMVEGDTVMVDDTDVKDSTIELETGSQEITEVPTDVERTCTVVHCNVKSHQTQIDMLKRNLDVHNRIRRQLSAGRGGKKLPSMSRSRTSRY